MFNFTPYHCTLAVIPARSVSLIQLQCSSPHFQDALSDQRTLDPALDAPFFPALAPTQASDVGRRSLWKSLTPLIDYGSSK